MYLARAKKNIDQIDQKEFEEKQAKHAERLERENSRNEHESESKSCLEFKPDELPDGACFRLKTVNFGNDDATTAIRKAEV